MNLPEGFATVTPYIVVDGAERFADFLVTAFGGQEIGRTVRPDNIIANLQIRIGTATLMISEANDKLRAMPAAYYLYVEDADQTQERAISAGATKIMDVMDMSYDDRQGGVQDPFGNYWWISQRLVQRPYH